MNQISHREFHRNPPAPYFAELIGPALYYGNARHPLARVVPDTCHRGMWRVLWPDGSLSDLVNFARAKDAAQAMAERGPPARNRRLFHWKQKPSKRGWGAPPIAEAAA